jgi:uncharacterized protein YjdB
MFGRVPRRLSASILATIALTLVACERPTDPSTIDPEPGLLAVHANVSATTIATMVVTVTGPGIPNALVFNLQINNGTATGTIVVPAGSNRTIEIDAFDANQIETHHGEKTGVTVVPGTNGPISITLVPSTGNQPVTAQFGSFVVTVLPATGPNPPAPLSVGATLQLIVTITDNSSPPVQITPAPGSVSWATTRPAFFTVDGAGLLTAVKAGSGTIVATYNGFAGTLSISVQ